MLSFRGVICDGFCIAVTLFVMVVAATVLFVVLDGCAWDLFGLWIVLYLSVVGSYMLG